MDKKSLEAKLPIIDKIYQETVVEMHRLEGEFRAIKSLIDNWPETKELVNAKAEPSADLRTESVK